MKVGTTFFFIKTLIEKALVKPFLIWAIPLHCLQWSPCLGHGHHALTLVVMHWALSLCIWHSNIVQFAWSIGHASPCLSKVTMPSTYSPCLQNGRRAFGIVTISLAWSPNLWHWFVYARSKIWGLPF